MHWLPIAAITYKTKHSGLVGVYDLLHDYEANKDSAFINRANKLQRPQFISSFADRSFLISAPTVCNSLSTCGHQLDPLTFWYF